MANEVDRELTSAVTDPSSGSLLGVNTTGEDAPIQHTASSAQDNRSQIPVGENENVDSSADSSPDTGGKDKDEKVRLLSSPETGTVPHSEPGSTIKENINNSGKGERDNRVEATSETENSKETKARDNNERGDGLKDGDKPNKERVEDEDQDRDMNSHAEPKKETTSSLEDVDSSADSSPDTGGKDKDEKVRLLSSPETGTVPHSEPGSTIKENINNSGKGERDNRVEATSETENSKETKARDNNERGDGLKDGDKPNKERVEDEDQDRGMNSHAEPKKETTSSLEDVDSSADSSPDTGGKVKDEKVRLLSSPETGTVPHSEPGSTIKENINNSGKGERDNRVEATSETENSKETEKARDNNERGDGLKDGDKPNKERVEDEDQDRGMNSHAEPKKETTSSLEDNRVEATSETENSKETKARDNNERGDGLKDGDKPNKERVEDEDQDRGMNSDAEPKKETTSSLEESLQHKSSGFLLENQRQIRVGGNDKLLWICAVVVLLASVGYGTLYLSASTPPVPKEFNIVDVFNQEMEKLKTHFPNQRPELWRRSLIHLRRHLKTEQHTEPVSLILTSGHRAERTLGCLAQCLAHAFSTARNSSVLNINGKGKASQDSDQVKLDIDSELRNAFEGKKFAAVIHRFEELPPGSTLIFYRYCDHENAAYKNVFLAFTVMLDTEVEVPSNVSLGRVEEMVQEHVKQKFVSSDKLATFNQMDVDKLGGLWSRISHLILPVAAEEKIEHQGCGGDCGKSF